MIELFFLTLFLALVIRVIEGAESNDHKDEDLLSDSNRRDVDYGDVPETTRCEIDYPYALTGLISAYDYIAPTYDHDEY